ncbi:RNA-directed DNA polymerase, eukaryota [Tanacetum coccineum]
MISIRCPPIFCFSACSKVFTGDIYEDHVVSCAGIIGFKHQDNVVRNTLVDICFRSGILAGIEVDIGLGGGCLALTQTGMVDFMSVRVAIDVAHRKQVKYKAKCADIRYGFLPLLFSLLGELEKDVATLLKRIRKFFVTQDIGERAAIQIFNRATLATLPFTFRGLGVYSAVDVLNYAFLTSILHSASLQIKLLRHSDSLVKYQMKDRTSDWLRAVFPYSLSRSRSLLALCNTKDVDLISHCHIRVGNGLRTQFWNEVWIGDTQLRVMFPRIYALEINKDCTVADKLQFSVTSSLRRSVRGGVKSSQLALLQTYIKGTLLFNMEDRWVWDLNGEGVFRVKDVRILLDECFLPKAPTATRWVKYVPIKINVFAWKVFLDRLPTRSNLQHRGVLVSDLLCPLCFSAQEDSSHLFFSCRLVTDIVRLVCRWWNLSWTPLGSYADWLNWFNSIRLSSKVKDLLEGVLYITWWSVWMFRNQLLFSSKAPRKDVIFDDIVSRSFTWCLSRFYDVIGGRVEMACVQLGLDSSYSKGHMRYFYKDLNSWIGCVRILRVDSLIAVSLRISGEELYSERRLFRWSVDVH